MCAEMACAGEFIQVCQTQIVSQRMTQLRHEQQQEIELAPSSMKLSSAPTLSSPRQVAAIAHN